MTKTITVPVIATMRRRPDGSYEMANAKYVTAPADAVARLLFQAFCIPTVEEAIT